MNIIVTKKCTQCKTEKSIKQYSPQQKGKYLSSICNGCMATRSKNYYKENKEEITRKRREKQSDPDYVAASRERVRKWVANNIERARELKRIREHKRRTKIKNKGSFTVEEWRQLCDKYDNKCLCCGEGRKLTMDHVVPVVSGGANTIDNIQPLCLPCNMKKSKRIIDYR